MHYSAHPTIRKFHQDNSFFRCMTGPLGSGKSHGAGVIELFTRAQEQAPFEGVRKTRFVVIRNSYRELSDTLLKTYEEVISPEIRTWKQSEMKSFIEFQLPDGTLVESEVLFRALDKPSDIGKLLSLELTGGFLNEAREIPFVVPENLMGRVGRYPSARHGGCTWSGIWADSNKCSKLHWMYRKFEIERPDGWKIFHQPPAVFEDEQGNFTMNPAAENLENLPPNYYERLLANDREWIGVFLKSNYGFVKTGKAIFPSWIPQRHIRDGSFTPDLKGGPIFMGIDFGLTPAAVWGQRNSFGQMVVFRELVLDDHAAVELGENIRRINNQHYQGFQFVIGCDPAGEQRSQTDKKTPIRILRDQGLPADKAPTNDLTVRLETIKGLLSKLVMNGEPMLVTTIDTPMLNEGLGGGYSYRQINSGGVEERYSDQIDKNQYSHICDALGYLCGIAGETYSRLNSFEEQPTRVIAS